MHSASNSRSFVAVISVAVGFYLDPSAYTPRQTRHSFIPESRPPLSINLAVLGLFENDIDQPGLALPEGTRFPGLSVLWTLISRITCAFVALNDSPATPNTITVTFILKPDQI